MKLDVMEVDEMDMTAEKERNGGKKDTQVPHLV